MTDRTTWLLPAAAIIASQSSIVSAIGFSTTTWSPAWAAAIACSACSGWGVQTTSASSWPLPSIPSKLGQVAAPCVRPSARARSWLLPATPTSRAAGIRPSAAAWSSAALPGPTIPNRTWPAGRPSRGPAVTSRD
jgi:hypothetical protein